MEQIKFAWQHNSQLAYFPLKLKERSNVTRPALTASQQAANMTFPLLQLDTQDVLITAFRCIEHEGQTAWVARLVNFGNNPSHCRLTTGFDFANAYLTDMQHNICEKLTCSHRQLTVDIAIGEIATVMFL
jgi:hypothetical protein